MQKLSHYFAVFSALVTVTVLTLSAPAFAAVGDGTADSVTGDNVAEILPIVKDHGFENITVVLVIFAALVAFSFGIAVLAIGVRKSLAKLKMLVRSA